MSLSIFNRRWSAVILESLSRHHVRHICIAPGSRSTPLTLEAAANKKFIHHTHFDERGIAFFALGLAKALKEPVAVIVTSGTAVANLYPALIEASLTGEKVIFLTADRPPELINCGANQAINQQEIYGNNPTIALNLPRPTPDISAGWLVSVIDSAMANLDYGPMQINCPFAEPLYGGDAAAYAAWSAQLGDWWQGSHPWLREERGFRATQQADWHEWQNRPGVVLAGRMSAEEGIAVADWAKQLGWPLLGDVLSSTGQPLAYADIWLNNPKAQALLQQAEIVIQFGANPTGKRMLQWQAKIAPKEYWVISETKGRLDPHHHRGRRLVAAISEWLALHPVDSSPNSLWAKPLNALVSATATQVSHCIETTFGEAQVAAKLPMLLPKEGQLFVGNSLIVRLIDALAQLPQGYPVYSNRGASGIDGLIATAVGSHLAMQRPSLMILGDISALYDLNSLALLTKVDEPMVVIIVNNDGGSIFSLLPTPEKERQDYYRMPHGYTFEHGAKMFNLDYCAPNSFAQLAQCVQAQWHKRGALVVELVVNQHDGAHLLQQLVQQASEASSC